MNNKNKMNKKGISAIVATVMIILITVAAVSIVWTAIVPMIGDQLEAGTACFDAVSGIQISNTGYTCVDRSTGDVSVQMKRGAKEFELANVQVLISAKGSTQTFNIIGDSTISGVATVIGDLPSTNEERVYDIVTAMVAADIEEVQIAPIITTGNSEKTCDVSSTITLKDC